MTVPASAPLCIVPAHLRTQADADLLLRCLLSLSVTAPAAGVMVIDDGSGEDLRAGLHAVCAELGAQFYPLPGHSGYAAAANVGLSRALVTGRDAVLTQFDVEFAPGWLETLLARTDTQGRPAAVVGARVLRGDGRLRTAGWYFSQLSRTWQHRYAHGPGDLPAALAPTLCPVSSALMLVRREALASAGMLDHRLRGGFEDIDLCLRVFAAGGECVYEPAVAVTRHGFTVDRALGRRLDEWTRESMAVLAGTWSTADLSPFVPEAL